VDEYSESLVRITDMAIWAIQQGNSRQALQHLRRLRQSLADGLPEIIATARRNTVDLSTSSLMNAESLLREAEARGDAAVVDFARRWMSYEKNNIRRLAESGQRAS
jgi:hypothetical protein